MRRRRYRRARRDWDNAVLIAFGLGLFLALFCSFRLLLLALAAALIYLALTSCW